MRLVVGAFCAAMDIQIWDETSQPAREEGKGKGREGLRALGGKVRGLQTRTSDAAGWFVPAMGLALRIVKT
jgi:hypothetical protein